MNRPHRSLTLVCWLLLPLTAFAQDGPTTREMNLIGWQEFAELSISGYFNRTSFIVWTCDPARSRPT